MPSTPEQQPSPNQHLIDQLRAATLTPLEWERVAEMIPNIPIQREAYLRGMIASDAGRLALRGEAEQPNLEQEGNEAVEPEGEAEVIEVETPPEIEPFLAQFDTSAHAAYNLMVDNIKVCMPEDWGHLHKLTREEIEPWLGGWLLDRVDDIKTIQKYFPKTLLVLSVAPNIDVSSDNVLALAKSFSMHQPNPLLEVDSDLLAKFKVEELTGPVSRSQENSPIRFSIGVGGFNPEYSADTKAQRDLLAQYAKISPNIRDMSVFDELSYLYAFRMGVRGGILAGEYAQFMTSTRHVSTKIREKQVLRTHIAKDGHLVIKGTDPNLVDNIRLQII
jgi:hypothetical protein